MLKFFILFSTFHSFRFSTVFFDIFCFFLVYRRLRRPQIRGYILFYKLILDLESNTLVSFMNFVAHFFKISTLFLKKYVESVTGRNLAR